MEMLSGELWLAMSGITFFATFIQVLTGFGFGLVAVPLLLFVLPSQQALLAGMILSMMASILQGFKTRHLARWDLIFRLLLLSIPGLAIGVALSGFMNEVYIKGVVGIILLGYVSYQWVQLKSSASEKEIPMTTALVEEDGEKAREKVPKEGNINVSSKGFTLVAFSSGLLNGLAAIPGPPVVALLIKHLSKDAFQATTVNFFFFQYAMTTASKILVFRESFTLSFGIVLVSMILAVILGYVAGQPFRKKINEAQFKKLVYGLLLVIGLTSIAEPLKDLFL
ncbi:MAG TPA: sulfite exporter TauE/SafE family protein [Desulfitobacterium dehalogenans]|uniref:Probable membrane transporter protein n=1 Tax=Desulfitobacterium dehalogenans TaxID=36854 RepID=A0A7C7D7X9_9FIRM|nr:sulfite exporter TauE/SafE family protein [Desulfitobacterium dehalogenans]